MTISLFRKRGDAPNAARDRSAGSVVFIMMALIFVPVLALYVVLALAAQAPPVGTPGTHTTTSTARHSQS